MLLPGVPAGMVMKWIGCTDYQTLLPYVDRVGRAKEGQMSKINSLLKR